MKIALPRTPAMQWKCRASNSASCSQSCCGPRLGLQLRVTSATALRFLAESASSRLGLASARTSSAFVWLCVARVLLSLLHGDEAGGLQARHFRALTLTSAWLKRKLREDLANMIWHGEQYQDLMAEQELDRSKMQFLSVRAAGYFSGYLMHGRAF